MIKILDSGDVTDVIEFDGLKLIYFLENRELATNDFIAIKGEDFFFYGGY